MNSAPPILDMVCMYHVLFLMPPKSHFPVCTQPAACRKAANIYIKTVWISILWSRVATIEKKLIIIITTLKDSSKTPLAKARWPPVIPRTALPAPAPKHDGGGISFVMQKSSQMKSNIKIKSVSWFDCCSSSHYRLSFFHLKQEKIRVKKKKLLYFCLPLPLNLVTLAETNIQSWNDI